MPTGVSAGAFAFASMLAGAAAGQERTQVPHVCQFNPYKSMPITFQQTRFYSPQELLIHPTAQ